MKQIHVDDPWHAEVICRRIDSARSFRRGYEHVVSVTQEGKLLGGVLFENYRGSSIEMHVDALQTDWGNRRVIHAVFYYPFEQLGVNVVYGWVPTTNPHAIDFDQRLGFREVHRLKNAVPDGDLVLLSMERHQCRWLKPK